jgi:hypothetical protein
MSQVPERDDDPLEEDAPRGRIIWAANRGVILPPEKAQVTGGTVGGDGRDRWPPVLLLAIGVAVLALVVMRAPVAVRAAPVIAYVMTVPGLACVRLARLPDRLAEFALAIGLSLALGVVVAQAMIYLRVWSPTLGIAILIAIASIAACVELVGIRRGPPAVAPPDGRWTG